MTEVGVLLDKEARRISAPVEALEVTLLRGHRRRRRARMLTIAFAVSVAAGGLAGAFTAFHGPGTAQPASGGSWTGIWPQGSISDAEAAQVRADAGDSAHTWELAGKTVLRRFALDELGWTGLSFLEIRTGGPGSEAPSGYNNESDLSDQDASGPFRFIIVGCDSGALGPGVTCPSATVTIQRLLRHDRSGIWSVIKVEDRGTASGAYPTPSP